MVVKTTRDGALFLIQMDSPPVNALGLAVREGLVAAIDAVDGDETITAVVLTGTGRFFSAGADITEFGKPIPEPHLPAVLARIEKCRVPVVAAVNGTALGGGLETALACRFRIGSPGAKLGLPEVNLGLIPGAGGTQRLPRLVGMKHGAAFVSGGKPVDGAHAHQIGLLDQVAQGDVVTHAKQFALGLVGATVRPALCDVPSPQDFDEAWLDDYIVGVKNKARGQTSPIATLEAVRATGTLSFEDGIQREREIFAECMASSQRAGLVHAFFAERQNKKLDVLKAGTARDVQTIGILGAGTMGSGIAIACASAGYGVKLYDVNAEAAEKGLTRIKAALTDNIAKGRLSTDKGEAALASVTAISSLEALGDADLVIEAVVELMDVKREVFGALEKIVRDETILASNTSYLDINLLAAGARRPERIIGMHFFSPANIMKLLEIIEPEAASPDAIATAFAVGDRLGKVCVLSGVCDGFIGNRILNAYRREAEHLLEDGALPQDVDRAMRDFGMPMGLFQVADLAGLDIGWHNRRRQDATRDPNERYVDIADKLYEMGRLGQKTGAGYYLYTDGNRQPQIDPVVDALVIDASARKGITRRAISDDDIRKTILKAMVEEGQKILDEGIAKRASDIDLVLIHGYGFPRWRGGLMFYGEQAGYLP
ncbi:MAG: 3-hydroxyacyl-CoA dehydrogenase NAD-binding domain-containing protein [Pseudomonadota bacterium]